MGPRDARARRRPRVDRAGSDRRVTVERIVKPPSMVELAARSIRQMILIGELLPELGTRGSWSRPPWSPPRPVKARAPPASGDNGTPGRPRTAAPPRGSGRFGQESDRGKDRQAPEHGGARGALHPADDPQRGAAP